MTDDRTDRRTPPPPPDAQALAAAVVAATDAAIIETDVDGRVRLWNTGAELLYGYSAVAMLGRQVQVLDPDPARRRIEALVARIRGGEHITHHQAVRRRADGSEIAVSLTLTPIRGADGVVVGIAAVARDNVASLRYQDELLFLADHDPLTGAANLRRFTAEVQGQIQRARRHGERASVLLLDLDDFKDINDTHGHAAGDRVLVAVAAAVAARLRATDLVARIGGDEFAVLLPHASAAEADVLAADLRGIVRNLHVAGSTDGTLRIRASVGAGTIDADTTDERAVLAMADRAMYRDKTAGCARAAVDGRRPGDGA